MSVYAKRVILLLVLSAFFLKNALSSEFDDLVEYVNEYINYTTYYTLPEDNSELANFNDSDIYERPHQGYILISAHQLPDITSLKLFQTLPQTKEDPANITKNAYYCMLHRMFKENDGKVLDYGSFDFIIVGAGTAGTLLARRLSENSNWTVLLLEAGNDGNNFTDIPFMNLYTRNSEYNWGFTTIPQNKSCLGMVNKKCVYPTGKGLGGTAIIGDSVYARGNKADFDSWADLGLDGWSYEDLLPYFKKTEKIEIPIYEEDYHGADGLLKVNYTYPDAANFDAYHKAANLAGLNTIDYNGKQQIGISKFQWTIDFNKKVTGGNAFITPILNETTNLNLTLNAFTTQILFANNNDVIKTTGVQFIKNGKIYQASANKEVILSAGAVSSPQLLMLSGVGPQEDLEALNITVVKDLPVGTNLTDHPVYVGLYIRTNLTTDAGNVSYNLDRWIKGLGYFTTVFSADNIGFINTKNPGVEPPNVEILTINNPTSVPSATFYNLDANYTAVFSTFNTLTDFLVYCINLEPKSRGWLKLRSNSPVDFPLINPAFLSDEGDEDIQVLYESIQYIVNLTQTEPLQAINATIVAQAPECDYLREVSDQDYWYCAIRSLTSTLYHPSCTTRMGTNSSTSVVDKTLKVHGISNLRVIDSGSMPILVRGHPLAAIWAMAEKASDLIKTDYASL